MIHVIAAILLAAAGPAGVASLANPFVGTAGTGDGAIDDFPGASAPFGMIQWSPDTPSQPASGGYYYHDSEITGFSLTHLSGAGCSVFGDFGFLPVTGDVAKPSSARVAFSHDNEAASPGYYAVSLGNGTRVELAATARAGFAVFHFPATAKANVLVNAASDQAGVGAAEFHVAGTQEIAGSATSGGFCGMPNRYTVYFDVRFDRPFVAHGTWNGDELHDGASSVSGTAAGGWVTFDATAAQEVGAKAAISYVSAAGARANLDAEPIGALAQARSASAASWNALLGEVRATGGSSDDLRMLYTSLYHALLSPTLYSDADGSYRGFDGRVHRDAAGHAEYANFSGWDIYRTQVPLMALLAPRETSDMMESLVHSAAQGGWLPKWPVANGYSAVMGGDSCDPILAAAYAFGARDFDRAAALAAMLKNAADPSSRPGQGWYRPRPGLEEYLRLGYVTNAHATNVSPVPNGSSETLEYALDDFSIAQFARATGNRAVYREYARRAMSWTNVFDGSLGMSAARDGDGAFVEEPIGQDGQNGFQEGNGAQYTWMVPQSEGALVEALGGPAAAQRRLDTFFSELNAGQSRPYAWLGNEPSIGSPWTYLYAGAPYKAQAVVRKAMTTLYAPTPDGLPGNDDLGTMSAWWAWSALGLYPSMPGTPVLLLGAPLFAHVEIDSPSGRTLSIDAPSASRENAYVESLRIDGAVANRLWIRLPDSGTTHLAYALGASPNTSLAAPWGDAPPSYEYGSINFPPSTTASLVDAGMAGTLAPGSTAQLSFGFANVAGAAPVALAWTVQGPAGIAAVPSSGTATATAGARADAGATLHADATLGAGLYNVSVRARAANGATVARATAIVRVTGASGALPPMAYVANFSDGSIVAIDPRTQSFGDRIAVGKNPGDLAVSRDGARVFVANQGSGTVSVVDTGLGKTVATVKTGKTPNGLRLSPDGKALWVTNYDDGTLQAIDPSSLTAYPPIPIGRHPAELAIAPGGATIYAAISSSNEIAVVDAVHGRLTTTFPAGDGPNAIALSPDGSRLYVANGTSGSVDVFDTATHARIARIPAGVSPQGIAVSPNGRFVYVANSASNDVTAIDAVGNAVLGSIPVGNGPFAVAFTARGDLAVVADSGDDECVLIDVARRAVAGRVATANFPIAVGMPLP